MYYPSELNTNPSFIEYTEDKRRTIFNLTCKNCSNIREPFVSFRWENFKYFPCEKH